MAAHNEKSHDPITIYTSDTAVSKKGLVVDDQKYQATAYGKEYTLPKEYAGASKDAPVKY